MAAAIRPASSWLRPSDAETDSTSCSARLIGSAPYWSWSASWVACASLNEPVIWALPPVIAPWSMFGAETTTPSSTTASWSSTEVGVPPPPYLSYIVVVMSPKALVPLPLKDRLTCQASLFSDCWELGRPAWALVTSSPLTTAGPSTYLTAALAGMPGAAFTAGAQETIWSPVASYF